MQSSILDNKLSDNNLSDNKLSIDKLFSYQKINHQIPESMSRFVNDMSYLKDVTRKLNKYKKKTPFVKPNKIKKDDPFKNKDILINLNKLSEKNFSEISKSIVEISLERREYLLETLLNIIQQENNKVIYVKLLELLSQNNIKIFQESVFLLIKKYLSEEDYLSSSKLIQLVVFTGVSSNYSLLNSDLKKTMEYIWNKAVTECKFKIVNFLLTYSNHQTQLKYITEIKKILTNENVSKKEKFSLMDLVDLLKKN